MNVRTLGGWALLANTGLTLIIGVIMALEVGSSTLFLIAAEALTPLLLVGLLALWTMQPHTGRLGLLGLIGLWCMGIAAGIAFVVRLLFVFGPTDIADFVPFSSALLGLVGSLLVGWVTIRARVFHPVIGWLLITAGALNLVGGLIPGSVADSLPAIVNVVAMLTQVGALGGYGLAMVRHSTTKVQATIEATV